MRCKEVFACLLLFLGLFTQAEATPAGRNGHFNSPDSVGQLLKKQRQQENTRDFPHSIKEWKSQLQNDYGLSLAGDYNSIFFHASESQQENETGSGVFRIYGAWELLGRGTANSGSVIFKVEHRHSYTDIAPTDFGFEVGYLGLVQSTFSDQGLRTTNLYWKQKAADGKFVTFAGFLDVTDYVDVYLLASPWESFNNLVFATGSATIAGLPDGALGVMTATWLTERLYLVAGIADANASPTDVFRGFKTLFNDFETFKSLELGLTTARESVFFNNIHATLWQIDARTKAGTPRGWGASFSATTTLQDQWLAFLRGGWSDEGDSLLSRSLSIGAGYQEHQGSSVFGMGLNWGKPNHRSYPDAKENQYTAELFYRWQPLPYLQITPSLQFIINPALAPDTDSTLVFGIRMHMSL
ncbi:carbohydrate porin [Thiolapillus sp.]